jgi:hypothetical protein
MTVFNWQDIDHSLVSLKLTDLAEEMHNQIRKDEARIQFENLHNLNIGAVPSLLATGHSSKANDAKGSPADEANPVTDAAQSNLRRLGSVRRKQSQRSASATSVVSQ